MVLRGGISKQQRRRGSSSSSSGLKSSRSYESMMKTILLQNQQIIIQQQNMMLMVMKQFHPNPLAIHSTPSPQHDDQNSALDQHQTLQQHLNHLDQHQHNQHHLQHLNATLQDQHIETSVSSNPANGVNSNNNNNANSNTNITTTSGNSLSQGNGNVHQHLQQVASHLQENMANYLTPAASEQDPISDSTKTDGTGASESDELSAILEGDGLLTNNLLYNPSTDIGSITPYKNHHHQQQQQNHHHHSQQHRHHSQHSSQQQSHFHQEHQTPSYYSSGGESLSTPRVEHQRQSVSISQNVVKNLNNSFKSPSKPQINVQILSGSATREMRKSKIIQSMNISEFLRQVHHDDSQKSSTSATSSSQ